MCSHIPSPRVNHKDLYPWASSELLDDSCSYNHCAFARRHDDDITVLPCTLGEPVCGDERANDGIPFFYFYQVVFQIVGVRLPFSRFERELLTEINTAPAQLYPNSWAFVTAFLHFFEVKCQRNNLWVKCHGVCAIG